MPEHHPSVAELTERNVQTIAEMERAAHQHRTFGQRVADGFAAGVGSWTFIIIQSVLLVGWIIVNAMLPERVRWDPYPFILLNLGLSFQAAYASPIIMMSQNRQARLADRRHKLDLQINLLAEQEATEVLRLLRRLCEHHKLPLDHEPDEKALEQKTKPEQVIKQIEQTERQ